MKSGLRYEICLCIRTGDLVWVNGPFPCGNYPDISIFRSSLMSHLEEFERVEADDGCIGEHPQYIKSQRDKIYAGKSSKLTGNNQQQVQELGDSSTEIST